MFHWNNISTRNKFELLFKPVRGNIDVLLVYKTKKDESFSIGMFLIRGFSPPYRPDRDSKGGVIMLFIRDEFPSIIF